MQTPYGRVLGLIGEDARSRRFERTASQRRNDVEVGGELEAFDSKQELDDLLRALGVAKVVARPGLRGLSSDPLDQGEQPVDVKYLLTQELPGHALGGTGEERGRRGIGRKSAVLSIQQPIERSRI